MVQRFIRDFHHMAGRDSEDGVAINCELEGPVIVSR